MSVATAENVFKIDLEQLPTKAHGDDHGKLMVYEDKSGWQVINWDNVEIFAINLGFTHWTFTPNFLDEKQND